MKDFDLRADNLLVVPPEDRKAALEAMTPTEQVAALASAHAAVPPLQMAKSVAALVAMTPRDMPEDMLGNMLKK